MIEQHNFVLTSKMIGSQILLQGSENGILNVTEKSNQPLKTEVEKEQIVQITATKRQTNRVIEGNQGGVELMTRVLCLYLKKNRF